MKINGEKRSLFWIPFQFFPSLLLLTSNAATDQVCTSSCGEIRNITSPFRLTSDPLHCGDLRYNLSCENNVTILYFRPEERFPELYPPKRYVVKTINYDNYTIRLADSNMVKGNCSSLPENTLSPGTRYFSDWNPYIFEPVIRLGFLRQASQSGSPSATFKETIVLSKTIMFFGCERKVNSSRYIESPCKFKGNCSKNTYSYYYIVENGMISLPDIEDSCCIEQVSLISLGENNANNASYLDVYSAIVSGFELSWVQSFDKTGDYLCYLDEKNRKKASCLSGCSFIDYRVSFGCSPFHTFLAYIQLYLSIYGGFKYVVAILTPRTVIGFLFIIGLIIYKWRRRHYSMYEEIEKFLQSHNNLAPIRYTYSEIKKMTNGFKVKLGEGGFGSVYKGKLRRGHVVAIKMLDKSKGAKTSWQDFVNEVATIGRVRHVNIVQLIGFCIEGSNKRGLVFDFMPNGSLDKYIFSGDESNDSLSCEQRFEISLGIARGIEYLHSGCDMQILHFDIKPNNILLDENFEARVSDFGLARLCPPDNIAVALTAARGTIGYIAPELFYKNIGGVSNKSDVYSFGMLLMEIANRRRNDNVRSEDDDSDATYFPVWIHDQFMAGKGIEIVLEATELEMELLKKMFVAALWCIQLRPSDRPSMKRVIEMLEGDVENLEMPPKPCLFPQEKNVVVVDYDHSSSWETSKKNTAAWSSTVLSEDENSMEISLVKNSF